MIRRFVEKVDELGVDVLVGYNSANFDISYLIERSSALRIPFDLSRFEGTTRLESHGLVDKVRIGGRVHIDMYLVMRFVAVVGASEHILKLNSYTLKNVYEAISKDTKLIVDKRNIFKMWDGSKEELEELATVQPERLPRAAEGLRRLHPDNVAALRRHAQRSRRRLRLDDRTARRVHAHAKLHDAGEMIPNKPSEQETRERLRNPIVGAYVKTPEPGIYSKLVPIRLQRAVSFDNNFAQHRPIVSVHRLRGVFRIPHGCKFDKRGEHNAAHTEVPDRPEDSCEARVQEGSPNKILGCRSQR